MPTWRDLDLVDPITGDPLKRRKDGAGAYHLVSTSGATYPVVDEIPRLVPMSDADQRSTSDTFGFKWARTETYSSRAMGEETAAWYLAKYGFASLAEWAACFRGKRVLDVGCGSAFSAKLWLDAGTWDGDSLYVGADISTAVDVAAQRLANHSHVVLVQADALRLPFPDASFDCLFSEGVLHHTPSPRAALAASARTLRLGGRYFFYLYKRKAPLREWTDDYVRTKIAGLDDAAAWEEMRSLTRFGQALAGTGATITLDQPVPLLGFPAGTFNLQRFLYNHVAKAFWNDRLSFEENVHVNFDWYRPAYCHRQTPEEVQSWCVEALLDIDRMHVDDSGISIIATRRTRR